MSASPAQPAVRLARHAMATRFELVLHGDDPIRLRAIGEEALDEIDRIEQLLSIYRPTSELSEINRLAAHQPVPVSPDVFDVLSRSLQLSALTEGAFDITIAPLVKVWGFMQGAGQQPTEEWISAARALVGWKNICLLEESRSVRFAKQSIMLDLGSVGKGFALEKVALLLREYGIQHALIHGGTSTVVAIGPDAQGIPWKIALPPEIGGYAHLCDTALSVSAVWGKSFTDGDRVLGHVLDPVTGWPVAHSKVASVQSASALETDALSTALLVRGPSLQPILAHARPGILCNIA